MKNVKEIEFKVEGQEWTNALDKAFKKVAAKTEVDGFRKGKIPKNVFIKKFGIESLYNDAIDSVLEESYRKVLDENNLKPVIEPSIDLKDINENGATLIFKVIEKPEVKLGKYTKLGVKKDKVEVSDKDVNEALVNLQKKYADLVELEEGKLETGDTAIIDFKGIVDGKELEGGSGSNYPLEIGSNTFIPGFEEGLVGLSVGSEKVLNLKFPENYTDTLKNKDVEFTVKLNKIKRRVLPELNEEFFKDLNYENVSNEKELKEYLKKELTHEKEHQVDDKYTDEVIDKAVENLTVEINPEIIDHEVSHKLEEFERELKMQGLTLEQYLEFTKGSVDAMKESIRPAAEKNIKFRYLLEEVAEKENITVSDEDVNEEVKKISEMYNATEDEVLNMIGDKEYLVYDLKMRKAIDFLKNN